MPIDNNSDMGCQSCYVPSIYHPVLVFFLTLNTFCHEKRNFIPASDSFVCCGNIRDLDEMNFFEEFLKFVKVFGLKSLFFFLNFVFRGQWSISSHLLLNPKTGIFLINVQILPITVEFTGYLLFYYFKYNNDGLRIQKLLQCKQFQMIFGKQVLLYI